MGVLVGRLNGADEACGKSPGSRTSHVCSRVRSVWHKLGWSRSVASGGRRWDPSSRRIYGCVLVWGLLRIIRDIGHLSVCDDGLVEVRGMGCGRSEEGFCCLVWRRV